MEARPVRVYTKVEVARPVPSRAKPTPVHDTRFAFYDTGCPDGGDA
ncbi:MAG: hypothetical protein Tsb0013_13170 [Phycisphaerales bacterium]